MLSLILTVVGLYGVMAYWVFHNGHGKSDSDSPLERSVARYWEWCCGRLRYCWRRASQSACRPRSALARSSAMMLYGTGVRERRRARRGHRCNCTGRIAGGIHSRCARAHLSIRCARSEQSQEDRWIGCGFCSARCGDVWQTMDEDLDEELRAHIDLAVRRIFTAACHRKMHKPRLCALLAV